MTDRRTPSQIHPLERHSPFHRLIGWEVVEWGGNRAVLTCDIRPDYMNRGGNLHGGLVATLIDAAAGYAALGGPAAGDLVVPGSERGPMGATLSLTVNYLGTAHAGLLTVTAVRTGGGKSVSFVRVEVARADGTVIAEGVCTYRRFAPRA